MITTEELAFWIETYKEESAKNFTLEQLVSRLERSGTFLREKFIQRPHPLELNAFFSETALRTSVTAYLIAEKIKE